MEMNESYNYPLIIYDNIDGDGDHTSFFLGAKKVSAKKFKLLVKLCAMQFQELGIGPNSIVAFNIKNPMMSHALRLACGLNGAAFVEATKFIFDENLNVTHVFLDNGPRNANANKNVIYIDKNWINELYSEHYVYSENFYGFLNPTDVAAIFQSSGTTGTPKLIKYTARRMQQALEASGAFYSNFSRHVLLPPPSAILSVMATFNALSQNKSIIYCDGLQTARALDADHVVGSPGQLLEICSKSASDTPRIMHATIAGGAVSVSQRDTLLQHFECIRITYASTEIGARVAQNDVSRGNIDDLSVGEVLPHITLEIVDENDVVASRGDEGRIRVRLPNIADLYYSSEGVTQSSDEDGWYYTGDLGRISEDGKLYISGRVDDVLNLNGIKINALDVEVTVMQDPHISECCLFKGGAEETGRDALGLAVVQKDKGTEEQDIVSNIKDLLSASVVHRVRTLNVYFVDQLPKNQNLKVERYKVHGVVDTQAASKIEY